MAENIKPASVSVTVGTEIRDNRLGDFYNAVDEIVCWFQANTQESDDMLSKMLRLYADGVEIQEDQAAG